MKTFLLALCLLALPFAAFAGTSPAADLPGGDLGAVPEAGFLEDGAATPATGCAVVEAAVEEAPLFSVKPVEKAGWCTAQDRYECRQSCPSNCTCSVLYYEALGYCFCNQICS